MSSLEKIGDIQIAKQRKRKNLAYWRDTFLGDVTIEEEPYFGSSVSLFINEGVSINRGKATKRCVIRRKKAQTEPK